jgi:hypothetical protein
MLSATASKATSVAGAGQRLAGTRPNQVCSVPSRIAATRRYRQGPLSSTLLAAVSALCYRKFWVRSARIRQWTWKAPWYPLTWLDLMTRNLARLISKATFPYHMSLDLAFLLTQAGVTTCIIPNVKFCVFCQPKFADGLKGPNLYHQGTIGAPACAPNHNLPPLTARTATGLPRRQ